MFAQNIYTLQFLGIEADLKKKEKEISKSYFWRLERSQELLSQDTLGLGDKLN